MSRSIYLQLYVSLTKMGRGKFCMEKASDYDSVIAGFLNNILEIILLKQQQNMEEINSFKKYFCR